MEYNTISNKEIQNIILISDVHFGVRNASIEWSENIISYFHNFFFPLMKSIKEKTPNSIVIIAGDYFDNRKALDLEVMDYGIDLMSQMAEILPVYTINGNHDVYKKTDNSITSLKIIKPIKNVTVITNNTVLETKYHKFLLLPWTGSISESTKAALGMSDIDCAIMHEEIKSMHMDNGREIVTGLDPDLFKGKIYSGHIHKRQVTPKVTYIGSPYQLRRSDIGNDKGIYVLNVETPTIQETFYKNDFSPKFLRFNIESILEMTLENLKKIVYNNYVDIVIKRKDISNINTSSLMSILDPCGLKKIEIIVDNSDIDTVLKDDEETTKDLTLQDIVRFKIEKLDITDEQKKKLLELNDHYILSFNESINN